MTLISETEVKNLLKKYQTWPSKRLGQNFLIDKEVIEKEVEAAKLSPTDIVLEIGPGTGNLTVELAKKVKKVIAVEKDKRMVEILKETLIGFRNVEIIQDDIRKFKNWKLKIKNYKVVANLPFYLVAPVIKDFLETKNPPKEMVLVVQKEVAQRICAKVPDMNLLAVSVQFYAQPEIISYVSKKSFWPSPKVDGAILKISAFNQRRKSAFNQRFFKIVKAGFSQPRKQLINNLSRGLALSLPKGLKIEKEKVKNWLLKNNIQPAQRAETLTIEDWILLTKSFTME